MIGDLILAEVGRYVFLVDPASFARWLGQGEGIGTFKNRQKVRGGGIGCPGRNAFDVCSPVVEFDWCKPLCPMQAGSFLNAAVLRRSSKYLSVCFPSAIVAESWHWQGAQAELVVSYTKCNTSRSAPPSDLHPWLRFSIVEGTSWRRC